MKLKILYVSATLVTIGLVAFFAFKKWHQKAIPVSVVYQKEYVETGKLAEGFPSFLIPEGIEVKQSYSINYKGGVQFTAEFLSVQGAQQLRSFYSQALSKNGYEIQSSSEGLVISGTNKISAQSVSVVLQPDLKQVKIITTYLDRRGE